MPKKKIDPVAKRILKEHRDRALKDASQDPRYQHSERQNKVEWGRVGQIPDHDHLFACLTRLPNDYDPYGYLDRNNTNGKNDHASWGADCSCGCKWYLGVTDTKGEIIGNWGVCTNARSHRCGLLTWEHQGCPQFEPEQEE